MSRGSRNGKCGCVLARTPPQIMRGEGDRQHKSPRSRSNKPCTHFELVPRPYLHPPSKKPGAAGGSGRTQAWEGHARETHCRRPPSHAQPDAYLGRTRPPPSSPAPVPTSCQEQPPPPPSIPKVSILQSPAGRARSPTSSLAARRSLPPPLRPPEPRTRSLARGFSGAHAYANIRAHLYERGGGWVGGCPRAKPPRTCTSECRDAARLPAAGSAPGSFAPPPAAGLPAAAHSCVRPALVGSASWAPAHGPGARAPRRDPARSLRVGGLLAELALRRPSESRAPALGRCSRASALNPFHPREAEARGLLVAANNCLTTAPPSTGRLQ